MSGLQIFNAHPALYLGQANINSLFKEETFERLSLNPKHVDRYAFAYSCYQEVEVLLSKSRRKLNLDKFFLGLYGNALRYGKFAVIGVAGNMFDPNSDITPEAAVLEVLS